MVIELFFIILILICRAETRRGKISVNHHWDSSRSVYAGDYILAVASGLMAKIRNEDVLVVLSQGNIMISHIKKCIIYFSIF